MKLQQTVLSAKHEVVGERFKIQALQVAKGIIFSVVQQTVIYVMTFWPCEYECDCPATKKHVGYGLKILGP
jgi:hypothetical protein